MAMTEAQRRQAFHDLSFTLADQLIGACLDSMKVRERTHWTEDPGYWLALLDDDGKEVFTFAIDGHIAAYLQYEIEGEKLRSMTGEDL